MQPHSPQKCQSIVKLGICQQSFLHYFGSSFLGRDSCKRPEGLGTALPHWLVYPHHCRLGSSPQQLQICLSCLLPGNLRTALEWLSLQKVKEGWRHRVSIISSAAGPFSTEKGEILPHRISAKVTDLLSSAQRQCGIFAVPLSLQSHQIFTGVWLLIAKGVSMKPPANSPKAGGFQSPNARETQSLTLT